MDTFNAEQLRYSDKYSDIIIGATPHSMKNKGDFSSVITMIENNSLKITNSNFKELLKQTRYYQEMVA